MRTLRLVTPQLLVEVASDPQEWFVPQTLHLIDHILGLHTRMGAVEELPPFRSLLDVQRREQEAADQLVRYLKQIDAESRPLPAPPLNGTENIIPLSTRASWRTRGGRSTTVSEPIALASNRGLVSCIGYWLPNERHSPLNWDRMGAGGFSSFGLRATNRLVPRPGQPSRIGFAPFRCRSKAPSVVGFHPGVARCRNICSSICSGNISDKDTRPVKGSSEAPQRTTGLFITISSPVIPPANSNPCLATA